MKNQKHAIIFALIAVFLWSTVATVFKLALMQLKPIQLVFYASLFSWLFLFVMLVFKGQHNQISSAFKNKPVMYLKLGVLNPFLYYLILFKAYELLPAQQAHKNQGESSMDAATGCRDAHARHRGPVRGRPRQQPI